MRVAFAGAFILLASSFPAFAGEKTENRVAQTKAWSLFYTGKLLEARNVVFTLTKSEHKDVRMEASHCLARIYWKQGSAQGRAEAQKLWRQIENQSTAFAHKDRMAIAKSIQLADSGKLVQAEKILDPLLGKERPSTATAEAALVYADVLIRLKNYQQAARAASFAMGFLKSKAGIELADTIKPFVEEAKKVQKRVAAVAKPTRPPKDPKPADPAAQLFKKAESLRAKKQFSHARPIYSQVMVKYPDSPFAPRSELHIGHCYLGSNLVDKARSTWTEFINKKPVGPWRGQAYVELIDTALTHKFDLELADTHGNAARKAMANPGSDSSWQQAKGPLHLRIGILALAKNKGTEAVGHLNRVLPNVQKPSKQMTSGVKRLVSAARGDIPTVPAELAADLDSKPNRTLALGVIYSAVGLKDSARTLYNSLLSGRTGPVKPYQRSFAQFGMAQNNASQATARQGYLSSVRLFAGGSWQDESLFKIAMSVISGARKVYRDSLDKAVKAKADTKINRARLASELNRSINTAVPYLRMIKKDFPKSRFGPSVRFYLGFYCAETNQFQDAANDLLELTKNSPKSPYAGMAYIRLMDIQLEHLLDINAARSSSEKAVAWVSENGQNTGSKAAETASIPLWSSLQSGPVVDVKSQAYQIYLRAGMIAYLAEKYDPAIELFKKADPYKPDRDFVIVSGHVPTIVEQLISAAQQRKQLAPKEVLTAPEKAKLILQISGIFTEAALHDKAMALCNRLLASRDVVGKPLQKSWAYCIRATNRLRTREYLPARDDYLKSAETAPKAPWASKMMFFAGSTTVTYGQDYAKAITLFEKGARQYPGTRFGIKALYLLGATYEHDGKLELAKKTYEDYLRRYPDSQWSRLIKKVHLKEIDQRLAEKNKQ